MSEFKGTPGPWCTEVPGPNGCPTVGTEMGLMTAMVAHSINEPGQKERAVADAKLIAAAPEMLAALSLVMKRGDIVQRSDQYMHEVLDAARAAIAKALGE